MKYKDFERYKLSTLLKFKKFSLKISNFLSSFNLKRYIFSKISKLFYINSFRYSKISKLLNLKRYIFSRISKLFYINSFRYSKISKLLNLTKLLNLKNFNLTKIFDFQILNLKKYNYTKLLKMLSVNKLKHVGAYFFSSLFFILIVYLSIPWFFEFNKSKIEDKICQDIKLKCTINGSLKYSFFPSPRLKLNDFTIKDLDKANSVLAHMENGVIKIGFFDLTKKEKINLTNVNFVNANINLNLKNLNKYNNLFKNKINLSLVKIQKGKINFLEDEKLITSINNINFNYKTNKKRDEATLKGLFLNDKIYFNFKNDNKDEDFSKIITLKLFDSKLRAKVKLFKKDIKNKKSFSGNFLFKFNKNELMGLFDFVKGNIVIKNANLKNTFLEGKLNGTIKFLPYFNYNLDINLDAINFTKLHSFFINFYENNKINLFNINKKLNGTISLSTNKIYSKYNFIDSFESRVKFINGNILIEQFLLNLRKIGAADVSGLIKNEKKFTNFKFESNIFIDNLKRFYNKFGIYNKSKKASNLFLKGNFDLINLNMRFDEITSENKIKEDDLVYIEKEFNDTLLDEGFESFFDFLKYKEFVKIILSEEK